MTATSLRTAAAAVMPNMMGGKSRRRARGRSASKSRRRARGRSASRSRGRARGRSASKSRRARRAGRSCKKGGSGYAAILKEAVVPFGLFAYQKKLQKKRHGKKTFRHSRKFRKH
jgi:hypothetical protein